MFGFEFVRLPLEADFAEAEGLVLGLAALVLGFDVVFEADFAGLEAFGPVVGFVVFVEAVEAEEAFADADEAFPAEAFGVGDAALVEVDAVFAGTETFVATSALACFATSLGAGGFAGFFFGGSCNSAKRSITSSIDCSESA